MGCKGPKPSHVKVPASSHRLVLNEWENRCAPCAEGAEWSPTRSARIASKISIDTMHEVWLRHLSNTQMPARTVGAAPMIAFWVIMANGVWAAQHALKCAIWWATVPLASFNITCAFETMLNSEQLPTEWRTFDTGASRFDFPNSLLPQISIVIFWTTLLQELILNL